VAAIDDPLVQATLSRTLRIARLKWVVVGSLVTFAVCIFLIESHRERAFASNAIVTDARVVDVKQNTTISNYQETHVVLEWTPNGAFQPVRVNKIVESKPNVGDPVTIRYDRRHPHTVFIGNNQSPGYTFIAFFFTLFAALVASPLLFKLSDRSRNLRRVREVVTKSEWAKTELESWWFTGVRERHFMVVRPEAHDVPILCELRGSIGQGWLRQIESSTNYEVCIGEGGRMVVRVPGVGRLAAYDPVKVGDEKRVRNKLSQVSPLMKAQGQ
jgi:hypothetical protein